MPVFCYCIINGKNKHIGIKFAFPLYMIMYVKLDLIFIIYIWGSCAWVDLWESSFLCVRAWLGRRRSYLLDTKLVSKCFRRSFLGEYLLWLKCQYSHITDTEKKQKSLGNGRSVKRKNMKCCKTNFAKVKNTTDV